MREITNELHKLPKIIDDYHEGELTAIALTIMDIALKKLNGELREQVCKVAFLLCDLEESFLLPEKGG